MRARSFMNQDSHRDVLHFGLGSAWAYYSSPLTNVSVASAQKYRMESRNW